MSTSDPPRFKLVLDKLIKSYMESGDADKFEERFFRDVLTCSPASLARPEDGATAIVACFDQLLTWAHSSLDVVRPELLTLSYYLFVKSYVRLIRKTKYDEAREVWRIMCPHFWAERGEQLRQLGQLTSADQLQAAAFLHDNPFISRVALERVTLHLSSASLGSLNAFLLESRASSLLLILNTEFKIETGGKQDGADSTGGDRNSDGRESVLAPLSWRVPGQQTMSCKRCRAWEPQSRRVVKEAELEAGADGLPDFSSGFFLDLLEGRVLPQLLRSKRGTGGATDYMELPPCGDDDHEGDKGMSGVLPSVLFATFANTYGDMSCLRVSEDGTVAVAGFSSSGKVLVWDWDSSRPSARSALSSAPCHFSSVQPGASSSSDSNAEDSLDLARAGSTVAGAEGGSIRGVGKQRSEEAPTATLVGHSQRVFSVSVEGFSGDNQFVLSSAADETVRLWDLKRGRSCTCSSTSECACNSLCLARYACTDGIPWSVEFGPFGYHFLVGNQGGTAVLHSTDRLSALRVFRGHTSDVTCSSFHPNAAYVATGSDDGSVRLWDIRDATSGSVRRMCVTQGDGVAVSVTAVQCSPCGSLVAAGYDNGTAAVWDVPTGRLAYVLRDEAKEPRVEKDTAAGGSTQKRLKQKLKQIYALRFDQATTLLATGGQDCAVKLWDLEAAAGQSQSHQYSHCLLTPCASFHTKFTPVYSLSGFMSMKSSGTVVVAGGPSSIANSIV